MNPGSGKLESVCMGPEVWLTEPPSVSANAGLSEPRGWGLSENFNLQQCRGGQPWPGVKGRGQRERGGQWWDRRCVCLSSVAQRCHICMVHRGSPSLLFINLGPGETCVRSGEKWGMGVRHGSNMSPCHRRWQNNQHLHWASVPEPSLSLQNTYCYVQTHHMKVALFG